MTTLYKWNGAGALIGVPARDLTDADFADFAHAWQEMGITEETIANCGLYEKVAQEESKRKQRRGNQDAAEVGES